MLVSSVEVKIFVVVGVLEGAIAKIGSGDWREGCR